MTPSSNETNAKRSPAGESRSLSQSPILRGAFVHRMGENLDDESMAAKFWTAQGFAVDTLEKPGERFSRRPDLRLLRGGGAWAYCEVKTVWQHRWTAHILHKDREEVRNELTNKSVEERIGGDLVTGGTPIARRKSRSRPVEFCHACKSRLRGIARGSLVPTDRKAAQGSARRPGTP